MPRLFPRVLNAYCAPWHAVGLAGVSTRKRVEGWRDDLYVSELLVGRWKVIQPHRGKPHIATQGEPLDIIWRFDWRHNYTCKLFWSAVGAEKKTCRTAHDYCTMSLNLRSIIQRHECDWIVKWGNTASSMPHITPRCPYREASAYKSHHYTTD